MFWTNQIAWVFNHQYLWKELINILDFVHEGKSPREVTIQDQFWLDLGISDHQYLWKESIDILVFLYRISHQATVAFEATTFDLAWPAVPVIQSDGRILW